MKHINVRHYDPGEKDQSHPHETKRNQHSTSLLSESENLFDSKVIDEKQLVNHTATKRLICRKPPLAVTSSNNDGVQTLKKNFQPRTFKNFKNMSKYECNRE
jgi:hypothetical protein